MHLTSKKGVVCAVLDTVEYLCGIDIHMELDEEASFKYLLETRTECLDDLEELMKLGDSTIAEKAEFLVVTYFSSGAY